MLAVLLTTVFAGSALAAPPGVVDYEWSQGNPPVQMMSVHEGFCAIHAITGKFEGMGESVRIFQDGSHWYLGGQSQQKHVGAGARCYPYNVFKNVRAEGVFTKSVQAGKPGRSEALPGHSICYLMGIAGKLNGSVEEARAVQDIYGTWFGTVGTFQRKIQGDFGCIDLYDSNGALITNPIMALDRRVQYYNQAPAEQEHTQFNLPNADDHLCLLTGIGGKFKGYGEVVSLLTDENAQALLITSQQRGVHAGVACYAYDQAHYDLPGMDYASFVPPRNEPQICAEACLNDGNCKAWTYVQPFAFDNTVPLCWLKNAVPARVNNDCCISGKK